MYRQFNTKRVNFDIKYLYLNLSTYFVFLHITCNMQDITVCVFQCSTPKYSVLLHKPAVHITKKISPFCVHFKTHRYTTEGYNACYRRWLPAITISSVQLSVHMECYGKRLLSSSLPYSWIWLRWLRRGIFLKWTSFPFLLRGAQPDVRVPHIPRRGYAGFVHRLAMIAPWRRGNQSCWNPNLDWSWPLL
jgi:hypothetical protein